MAAVKLSILYKRLAQAVKYSTSQNMGTDVCWGASLADVMTNQDHILIVFGLNPDSETALHAITVDKTGHVMRDTVRDAGGQGKLSGSLGSYQILYRGRYAAKDAPMYQIGSLTWPKLRQMADSFSGGPNYIPGAFMPITVITASALRLAICGVGPDRLQKPDLHVLLEYVVENMVKNPVTQKELEADTYHKPMQRFAGFDIKVENPRGTYRSGVDQQGTPWKNLMSNTYGEFMSTMAVDGDPVDVFLGDRQDCQDVFIVHQSQKDNWDQYDEDKVMLGFTSMEEALTAYLRHYNGDKRFIMQVTVLSRPVFKAKLLNCHNGLLTDFRG